MVKRDKYVQAEAFCEGCEFPTENGKSKTNYLYSGSDTRRARKEAEDHHKKTGHKTVYRVTTETVMPVKGV